MKALSATIIPVLLFFLAPAVSAGAAAESGQQPSFTKHFRHTFFAITDKAEFSVEVLPDEKEYRIGRNVVGIVVHDRHDRDVERAVLTVTAEGSSLPLTVREKGGGLYVVPNLDLQRQGPWKLSIQVRDTSVEDRAVFLFPPAAPDFAPPGKYSGSGQK